MRLLRHSITLLALLGLAAGYAASQIAFFTGRAPEYAQMADRPAAKIVALALLCLAIVLAFLPDEKEARR